MTNPTKRSFSFEFKVGGVQRFVVGETKVALAQELDLSSPKLIETWAREYRGEGESGLYPKRSGRPAKSGESPPGESGELERLRRAGSACSGDGARRTSSELITESPQVAGSG